MWWFSFQIIYQNKHSLIIYSGAKTVRSYAIHSVRPDRLFLNCFYTYIKQISDIIKPQIYSPIDTDFYLLSVVLTFWDFYIRILSDILSWFLKFRNLTSSILIFKSKFTGQSHDFTNTNLRITLLRHGKTLHL